MPDDSLRGEDRYHRFMLENPVMYGSKSGDRVEAEFIELRPPTTKNSRECAYLKQAFFRAASDQSDGSDSDQSAEVQGTEEGPSAEGIMAVISMSQSVDLPDLIDVAKKLFSSGVAYLDGEMKLTSHVIGEMDEGDFEKMLGEYLANFTVASVIGLMKG